MSQVGLLYRLQQLDTEIRQKKQRLGEVLRAQKETAELLAARQRMETAVAELSQWQSARRDLSLELESLNNKMKRSEQRLYSGNVKNPKELSDLQQEIASLERRRATLEDEILEAMIMVEDAEAEKEAAEAALAAISTQWEASQKHLKKEQNELALRLHKLTGEREEWDKRVEANLLREYEQLARSRSGVAVAGLKGNMCQGCQMTVSAHKVREANQGEKVYCGGCGRIIYPL